MANQKKNQKANKEGKAMQNDVINEEKKAMQENTINENIIPENEEKETVNAGETVNAENENNESAQVNEEQAPETENNEENEEQAAQDSNEEQAPANEGEKEKRAPLFTENLLLSCWAICDNEQFKAKAVEEQRKIAKSVIDKNNVLLRNYDTLLKHYREHAPRSYERALWTVHVLIPNRENVLKEIRNAENFILNTYSKLSVDDIEKVEQKIVADKTTEYFAHRIREEIATSKKAQTNYIIVGESYGTSARVEFFTKAGVSGLIITGDLDRATRKALKESGYYLKDEFYEKPCEIVEGLGEIPSVDGMLYIKQ